MKKYGDYIFETKKINKLEVKLKSDISQFDLDELLENMLLQSTKNSTPDIVELLFILGAKLKDNSLIYSSVHTPNSYEEIRIKMAEILVKKGDCDPNTRIYINGIYTSVTCLTMICLDKSLSLNGIKNYNVIAKLIELGGDMTIKDNFKKSSYDYLTENDVVKLDKIVPNFRNDYELYISSDKYNI